VLLTIDIGNTNIVAGVFQGDETLAATWRLSTETRRMPDEYVVVLDSLFRLASIEPARVTGAAICSVVPVAQSMLTEAIRQWLRFEPMILTTELELGLDIRYSPSTSVGADRIANAVAAIEYYGVPAIVVDFGTATTFDALSRDRSYVGGAIAPGLEVSEEALVVHTAKLPRVPLTPPPFAIGRTTTESLQSGLLYGYGGMVDGLVERFKRELGEDARVVATGGLAATVRPCTHCIDTIDLDLTLQGLRMLYARNVNRTESFGIRKDQPVA
jgi:type III pantothenate kinase